MNEEAERTGCNPAIASRFQADAASNAGCFEQEQTEVCSVPVESGVGDESDSRLRILFVCFV